LANTIFNEVVDNTTFKVEVANTCPGL